VQLSERAEETSKAVAFKKEFQEKIEVIGSENNQLIKKTADIKQDMTRQYTSMQESLLNHINQLERANGDLRDLLIEADIKKDSMMKQKDAIIQLKDEEINVLKQKIDTMSDEFGEMLRETLDKMKERIEVSSGSYDAPEVQIQQKMDEIKIE
jgi:DNA anti-recombination protein RmuC